MFCAKPSQPICNIVKYCRRERNSAVTPVAKGERKTPLLKSLEWSSLHYSLPVQRTAVHNKRISTRERFRRINQQHERVWVHSSSRSAVHADIYCSRTTATVVGYTSTTASTATTAVCISRTASLRDWHQQPQNRLLSKCLFETSRRVGIVMPPLEQPRLPA